MYVRMYVCMYVCIYVDRYAGMKVYVAIYAVVYTHINSHWYMRNYIHTYIHNYIRIHTYIHTYINTLAWSAILAIGGATACALYVQLNLVPPVVSPAPANSRPSSAATTTRKPRSPEHVNPSLPFRAFFDPAKQRILGWLQYDRGHWPATQCYRVCTRSYVVLLSILS